MDWKTLFLTANGRIGKKDFWIGFLILVAVVIVLGWIPVLGLVTLAAVHYPWVCITAKRLHDFDKSGWLAAVPYVVAAAAGVLGVMMGLGGILSAAGMAGNDGAAGMAMLSAMGGLFALLGVAFLINIGFVLWVGLTDGTPGDNRFGPPPASLTSGATPPAAA